MADPLVIPSTYQVAIEATSGGQPVVNVIGIRSVFSNANEVGEAVKAAWEDPSGPCQAHALAYQVQQYRVTDLTSAVGPIAIVTSGKSGGNPGSLATNGASALISYNGGTRSRSSSGRMYHGPLQENDIFTDGRTMQSLRQGALSAVYQLFQANLASAGFEWVVISRKLAQAFPVKTPQCQAIIATQRRRIRGRS